MREAHTTSAGLGLRRNILRESPECLTISALEQSKLSRLRILLTQLLTDSYNIFTQPPDSWYSSCWNILAARQDARDFKEGWAHPTASHMVLLIASTFIMSAITGLMVSNERGGLAGQILHGFFSIACFALVGVAFWRFGWEVGVIDLILLFIAGNLALSFYRY